MSDAEDITTKLEGMNKKLISMQKIVKTILEKMEQKICGANEAVDRKAHGKPAGSSFEEKQKSYLEMLNNKRIKDPKPSTLEFYNIEFDKDKNMYYIM